MVLSFDRLDDKLKDMGKIIYFIRDVVPLMFDINHYHERFCIYNLSDVLIMNR